ncbi:calcium-activated potassium channel slowpoke-like isoform X2 [Watersipora subatra]|uniref:calcium-activated potassium channel slowpoke-like isoform X2 n=1 Tax=Watersipora subatra TaxID=2589382 RepID=UPI00355B7A8D
MSTPESVSESFTASLSNATTAAVDQSLRVCNPDQRLWYVFFLSSIFSFLGALILVSCGRCLSWIYKRQNQRAQNRQKVFDQQRNLLSNSRHADIGCVTAAKDWAGELISGQTNSGRILIVFVFFLSLASLMIYFIDAEQPEVERCTQWESNTTQQVDLAFNIFFMLYFVLRFVAAQDRLWFLIEIYSWVDYFTITPSFVSIFLNRSWIGLRFLRALRLLNIPDILQYLNILKTNSHIRLAHFLSMFLSFWLTGAGLIHLVENSGDPWTEFSNAQPIKFWECVYFILVTSSTVGYGDIAARTALGRIFMVFIIMGGMIIFASALPEIYEHVTTGSKYSGRYRCEKGKKHIVVCGHITYDSVSNFLSDFLHKDREDVDVEIVFIDKRVPDLDLEGLFKRHFTQVEFYMGSVMNANDLERVATRDADACLILANKYCEDPDAEDAANIMRAISIKNYYSELKVIIQLMQYHNKAYLLNVPSWDWKRGDDAVCLAELKLGFIAQSCLAPGFSTLLANLFTMRSYKTIFRQYHTSKWSVEDQLWQNDYLRGTGMEMYTHVLSAAFVGLTFPQAVEQCFTKLKLLLIAIEVKSEDGLGTLAINPGIEAKVEAGTQGFFIAQSDDEAKRAHNYCSTCHADVIDPKLIKKCKCKGRLILLSAMVHSAVDSMMSEKKSRNGAKPEPLSVKSSFLNALTSSQNLSQSGDRLSRLVPTEPEMRFDSTGMFHWCPSQNIDKCTIDILSPPSEVLSRHIIVCLFSEADSPLIGLGSFIMPLRASNFHFNDLKTVVLLGNMEYLRREWLSIRNFPKIYLMGGSPLNRVNLRAISINTCDTCIILSARKTLAPNEDPTLIDKSAILCSLNIKSMQFAETQGGLLAKHRKMHGLVAPASPVKAPVRPVKGEILAGASIPMVTELANDSNVQFLDQDDEDDPDVELYMTQPFACGTAFAVSVLDSLMSTSYFNENALTLIRTLVTGGATPDLEQIMAEGAGIQGGLSTPEMSRCRNRCKVGQISLSEGPFAQFAESGTFGALFLTALKTYGILCIGLHRFRDQKLDNSCSSNKRYVITNPPEDFPLIPTDMVFSFIPCNITGMNKQVSAPCTPYPIHKHSQSRSARLPIRRSLSMEYRKPKEVYVDKPARRTPITSEKEVVQSTYL